MTTHLSTARPHAATAPAHSRLLVLTTLAIALIGALTSGSLLGPASVLVIIAWWRIRRRNGRRLRAMAEEELLNLLDSGGGQLSIHSLGAFDDGLHFCQGFLRCCQ